MKLTIDPDKHEYLFGMKFTASDGTEYGTIFRIPTSQFSEEDAWELAHDYEDDFKKYIEAAIAREVQP